MDKLETPKIGDILREEFLEPLGITPYSLSKSLGVSTSTILDIVHNKRRISVEMALLLSTFFGTSSQFWLNMQNEIDIRIAKKKMASKLDNIEPIKKSA